MISNSEPKVELSLFHSIRQDSQLKTTEVRSCRKLQKERLKRRGYNMGKKLGDGTFGDVYAVRQGDKNYAVKISNVEDGSPLTGVALEIHIMTLAQQCENLISIVDFFLVQNVIGDERVTLSYYIMPQAECTLYYYSRHNGPLSEGIVKHLFYQIVKGLAFMHTNGIAHRDIKLQNILLDRTDERLVAKLADFGLSRIVQREGEQVELFRKPAGTMSYMAPEIMDSYIKSKSGEKRKIIPWEAFPADCWAVGICLYIMVANDAPFDKLPLSKTDRIAFGRVMLEKQLARAYRQTPEIRQLSDQGQILIQRLLEPSISERPDIIEVLNCCWFEPQKCYSSLYEKRLQ